MYEPTNYHFIYIWYSHIIIIHNIIHILFSMKRLMNKGENLSFKVKDGLL